MPALVSIGPGPEISDNPALSQAKGRTQKGETAVHRADSWRKKVIDLTKRTERQCFMYWDFQQFRTGSELVSGDQHCRWVFRQPTRKWVLAKIPQLTVFFFFFFSF